MDNKFETINSGALAFRIIAIILGCALLLGIPAAVQFLKRPNIVYQPVDACNMLTETVAKSELGEQVINRRSAPEINTDTSVATSKCSYSDLNKNNMSVVALAVQTGINDEGIEKMKDDFKAKQEANQTSEVEGIGKAAYFTPVNGQLNVIDDHHWYIFSLSTGDDITNTPKDRAIKFAKSLLGKI